MKIQKRRKLGRGVAVVGAGMSKLGMFRNRGSKDLFWGVNHGRWRE